MGLNQEGCLTLTLALAAVYLSLGEGQSSACDINARPHPQGICGPKLARAHSNLCFLLSQIYPKHFSGKRSLEMPQGAHIVYRIPMSVLSEADIRDAGLNKRDLQALTREETISRGAIQKFITDRLPESSPINYRTRSAVQILAKRRVISKRQTVKSGLVCDCCYNMCTPRHLATYC